MDNQKLAVLRARIWVLLAMDSCDRAGLTPVSKLRFHRFIFLSNCLADLFREIPIAKRVIKYKRGPFYPDVQWQLDRLNSMGLLIIRNVVVENDVHGPWMEADYLISETGIELVDVIKETSLGLTTAAYVSELAFAFARLHERSLSDIALNDLNYSVSGIAPGTLIKFEDARRNLAIAKAHEFELLAPEVLKTRTREKVQLYLKYIEEMTAA